MSKSGWVEVVYENVCVRVIWGSRQDLGQIIWKGDEWVGGRITSVISLHFRYSVCVISMAVGTSFLN